MSPIVLSNCVIAKPDFRACVLSISRSLLRLLVRARDEPVTIDRVALQSYLKGALT